MFITFPIVFQICDINAYFNHTLSKSNMCKTEQISRKTVFFVCDFLWFIMYWGLKPKGL